MYYARKANREVKITEKQIPQFRAEGYSIYSPDNQPMFRQETAEETILKLKGKIAAMQVTIDDLKKENAKLAAVSKAGRKTAK